MCIPLYSMHAYDKKNFSTRYILTFDTGLTFHSLVGLMHLIVRNEVSMGKKEPRINAEFNYRLSLSLSVPFPVETRAQSRSRFKWTRNNIWCGERVFHSTIFLSFPTFLQRVSTLECRYKLAETLIRSAAYFYTSTSIARFISPIVDIMITRKHFFSQHA